MGVKNVTNGRTVGRTDKAFLGVEYTLRWHLLMTPIVQFKTKTKTKCWKDPTYAVFWKAGDSRWFTANTGWFFRECMRICASIHIGKIWRMATIVRWALVFPLRKYIYCSPKIYDVTLRTPFDMFKTMTMICCSVKDLLWSPSSSLTSDIVHLLRNSWDTR